MAIKARVIGFLLKIISRLMEKADDNLWPF
jgi:hypothetical protein